MKSHSTIRYWICYLLLFVVLLALFVGTLCTGSVPFSLSEIGSVLMHPEQNTTAWKILWEIRMPRSLTAIILGGARSTSSSEASFFPMRIFPIMVSLKSITS